MKITCMFLFCLGLALAIAGPASGDIIITKDGKRLTRVRIVQEDLDKVVYDRAGLKNQTLDTDRVVDIIYQSTGNDYKAAVDAFKNQEWLNAAKLYEDYAAALPDSKDALRAHCMYRNAVAYQKAGSLKEAANAFARFVNAYKNHRLYPDALRRRAQCFIGLGDLKEARKAILYLKQQVDKKGLGGYWKYEVEYWIIFLQERDDPSRALKAYQDLYKEVAEKYPDVANKCRLRIGRVLLLEKKYDEALRFCDEIIENRMDADREVAAAAYMIRGRCRLSKAGTRGKPEEYKAALYDLLRVVVHYKDVGGPQAEAMYFAGKCFQLLGGKDSAKHWQGLYRRIQREWPGTPWAVEAAKELTG